MKCLTFEGWPGQLNNVRMSFECAVVAAFILKRELIVSLKATPRTPFADRLNLFDIQRLRQGVDLLCEGDPGFDDRLRDIASLKPEETLSLFPDPGDDDLLESASMSFFCFPSFPEYGSEAFHRMVAFAGTRQRVFRLPVGHARYPRIHMPPLLEPFYAYYFLDPGLWTECKHLVRNYVRYRPEIIDVGSSLAEALGAYHALHVRRNDFIAQDGRDDFPAQSLVESARKFIPAGARLYIATDEANTAFFDPLRRHYELVFLRDIATSEVWNLPPDWRAAIEQVICAGGSTFVGTFHSTFSAYITRLRGYHGRGDSSFLFTNGEVDDRPPLADGEFSWASTLKNNVPLWAREYLEGWT